MNIEVFNNSSQDQEYFKNLVLDCLKDFGFDYNPDYDLDLDNPSVYKKSGGELFLLKIDNKIIGSIAVINKENQVGELKRWYVAKNFRNQGLGLMLLERAIEFCKELGLKRIEFQTNKKFKKAHQLYKKKGFAVFKEDEYGYYMFKNLD